MTAGTHKKNQNESSLRLARGGEMEAAPAENPQAVLRDRFIDAAAHDIRTPLQVVGLHLHNLLEGKTAELVHPEVRRRLQVMERHVEILTRLSNRLIDVARADEGPLQLRLEHADLVEVVSRSVQRMGEQLAWAKCSATVDAKRAVAASVDVLRIDEVITALLLNVVKYAPGSPVVVSIRASTTEAVVRVSDKGPGIQAAVRDTIFKKYQRGSHVATTSGLGLGLWLSRRIINAHGGTLTVDERVKTGATFIIRLPLKPDHAAEGSR